MPDHPGGVGASGQFAALYGPVDDDASPWAVLAGLEAGQHLAAPPGFCTAAATMLARAALMAGSRRLATTRAGERAEVAVEVSLVGHGYLPGRAARSSGRPAARRGCPSAGRSSSWRSPARAATRSSRGARVPVVAQLARRPRARTAARVRAVRPPGLRRARQRPQLKVKLQLRLAQGPVYGPMLTQLTSC